MSTNVISYHIFKMAYQKVEQIPIFLQFSSFFAPTHTHKIIFLPAQQNRRPHNQTPHSIRNSKDVPHYFSFSIPPLLSCVPASLSFHFPFMLPRY
ncbi:hypothetical protein HanIR_Chr11g0548161 [Helianthus annuus]|nr:hypothetical protein HanIR_Chr11g0548161 [Helianthus annuus]